MTAPARPQLLSNAVWNLIAFAIALAANVLTVPYVIHLIGVSDFGAGGLIFATFAPFVLVGTALGQAVLREVAHKLAAEEVESASRIFSAALALCGVSCLVVGVLFLTFGGWAFEVFASHDSSVVDWELGLALAFAGWAAQQFTFIFQSTVAATQMYGALAAISAAASITNAVTIVVCVTCIPSALGFVAGTSAGYVASLIVWWQLIRRRQHWLFPLRKSTSGDYHAIIEFSKWQGLAHFAGAIGLQMDRYVLGLMASLAVVGQYNVAMRLQEVVHMVVLKAGEVLFPHLSITSDRPVAERGRFFVGASWAVNTFAACVLAPLVPLSWSVLALWVSPSLADSAAGILRTLVVASILGAGTSVFFLHMMAARQNAAIARITIVHATLTIAMTILFIRTYGAIAAGVGVLIANAIRLVITLILTRRAFPGVIALKTLFVCALLPLVGGVGVAWTWNEFGRIEPRSWMALFECYVMMLISVTLVCIALTAISRFGRRMLSDAFASVVAYMQCKD